MLKPELATILIKLVGDVSFLTEVRDNQIKQEYYGVQDKQHIWNLIGHIG